MARRGFPSMTALLGLLAVAGYQNRDKISEMLSNRAGSDKTSPGAAPQDLGSSSSGEDSSKASGLEELLGGFLDASGLDRLLGGGLSELTDRFRQSGRSETVESWVGTGPNRDVSTQDLEQTLGAETLAELSEHTGLSREEILSRLSRDLPKAVDHYTPEGRLPPQRT
ncbi:YidB family protein [Roseovarius sp. Pro17]|uniref:YidB family protein n=1 Tax=Roseovarius sp. Pro17 TaxID=3108175 RepID=UPI002D7A10A6|nr:YidB family protein [Roseovarius sp. Pro17]